MDALLESSEDKVKTLAQRTNGLTLVPFSPRTNSLPLSVPLTTEISFLSIAFFCFLLLNSLFLCTGLASIVCSTSHISDRVHCHLGYIVLFQFYKIYHVMMGGDKTRSLTPWSTLWSTPKNHLLVKFNTISTW